MRTLIGSGSSAEVWALDADRVLKLFYPNVAADTIEREFAASQFAHESGLRVARPLYRTGECGRYGIVFERISGTPLLRRIVRAPHRMWTDFPVMAAYQRDMHLRRTAGAMPNLHERIERALAHCSVSDDVRAAMLRLLAQLSEDDRLGHGDFHPGNVLVPTGGLAAIDWSKAWAGPPAADVARTELLIRFGSEKNGEGGRVPVAARAVSAWWYRRCYQRSSAVDPADIDRWRFLLAVTWFRGQVGLTRAGLPAALARWQQAL